ncbi:response regulator [Fulvivirga sp. RKSG066]|uniref:response regulator n=1 Tax=Fulvivirga aurantia TaxID=2529383 RepID=UPI0012BBF947|nr:response regulator [Fulvivirga aurantia]MTI21769.1 response regulator [Fulvivirga aurantia]
MKKVLIIEDNADIRENIAEILTLADYETLTASHGKEGVEVAMNEQPDLIICDIMMPELDGYGVLHILSKKESTASIPFIFLTAKAERADMRKGMILGADDYLTKPFDDTELLDAIEARLKKNDLVKKEYASSADGLNSFISDAKELHDFLNIDTQKKPRYYKKKNDIYRVGEMPLFIYFIVTGKVKTIRINEDGKELITGIYTKGDYFGYESLLKNKEHTDNAETMEDSEIIVMPKDEFFQLVYGNREIAKKFIEMLSNKVDEKEENLLHLAYNSVRQRTAEALLSLNDKFNPENEKHVSLTISRDDLANMVGTATESVIRVISDLKEEGILSVQSGKIVIEDTDKLEQIKKWHVAR